MLGIGFPDHDSVAVAFDRVEVLRVIPHAFFDVRARDCEVLAVLQTLARYFPS